jgi:hypothetical protein
MQSVNGMECSRDYETAKEDGQDGDLERDSRETVRGH